MEAEKNRFNMFGIGGIVILLAAIGIVYYTNPELITSWLSGESLKGSVEWKSNGDVFINNDSDVEWKDARVTLNKGSVSQRYEVTVPNHLAIEPKKAFRIGIDNFKKSNGEVYKLDNGAPHTITVEVTLPENKKGTLEKQFGGKKIAD